MKLTLPRKRKPKVRCFVRVDGYGKPLSQNAAKYSAWREIKAGAQ